MISKYLKGNEKNFVSYECKTPCNKLGYDEWYECCYRKRLKGGKEDQYADPVQDWRSETSNGAYYGQAGSSKERNPAFNENKKEPNKMTLTKDVIKRIIKEELDKIVASQIEEVDPADAEIEQLEKQLAEAKKAKAAKSMKKMKGDANAFKSAKSGMKPLKAKK
jgi:hypothetical protein